MNRLLDWPRYTRLTWIIAILPALLLLLLWLLGRGPGGAAACCAIPAMHAPSASLPPTAAPAPTANGATTGAATTASESAARKAAPMERPEPPPAGVLALRAEGERIRLQGTEPDQASKDRVMQASRSAYGEGNVIDELTVDPHKASSHCAQKIDGLLAAIREAPAVGVTCEGERVVLVGTVINEADKDARERWERTFFGPGLQLENRIEVTPPPTPVARAEDVRCGNRIAAAVTFATGSARIDASGRTLLDAIARCLGEGNYEVAGYTDNIGDAGSNATLSQARANAVRAYLVGKGVAGTRLSAVGHGADNPIADNATDEGRAMNRRIEFTRK